MARRKEVNMISSDEPKKPNYILIAIAAVILLVVGGFVITMLSRPLAVIEKVTDPDRIIATYEWFFNTKASIESYETQVQVAADAVTAFKEDHKGDLDSYVNSTELSRLREVERGLKNQLTSTVNSYNAQAKNKTRAFFKDSDLPSSYEITKDWKVTKNQ